MKFRCRVCLKDYFKLDILSIDVDKLENQNITIQDAFHDITTISPSGLGDHKYLCKLCNNRLNEAFQFRLEALSSENLLTNSYKTKGKLVDLNSRTIKVEKVDLFEQDDDGYWPEPEIDVFLKCESQVEIKNETLKTETVLLVKQKKKYSKKGLKRNKCTTPAGNLFLSKAHCRFCLQYFSNKLGVHEKSHILQNNGLECHHCGKKYLKRRILLEHLTRVHFMDKENRQRYPCDLCGKTYTEKSAVRSHKKIVHFGIVKYVPTFVCTVCGKEQKGKYALEKHIDMVHNNIIIGYCNECGKGFKTKISLVNHLKFVHLKLRPYQCKICLKGYIHRLELKRHMTGVHTEERAYSCITCGKKFKTEAILKNHMKLHTNDFSYPCQICGMTFKTISYVKAHMKAHSDECFFFCKVCPKKFKRSGQLTKHMRLHTGNLFYCNQCTSNGFVDQFTLQEHVERVHIGVKYRCGTCSKEYGCRKHLRQHQNAQYHDRAKWSKIDPRRLEPVKTI